uniref:UDP-glucuronosyltransferase 2B19-like isoform X2 n=1 Tax=Diabrotica virgifera virgifera TaxID=50390 RepID=A0A6P7FXA7_DIAVI
MQFKQLVSLLFSLNSVFGSNILFVSNNPSPSHQIWNYELSEGLLKKGHNITMLAGSPVENKLFKNYHPIDVKGLAKEIFGEQIDSLDSLENLISLLLCNLMQGFSHPQPLSPNIIPVGGLHIKPAKTLPEDLQRIMDNTEEGVILFSLGTNVKSSLMREDKRKAILDALGKLKETVLWKFEAGLKNIPKNVIIKKFLPQRDLLAHPNLKLFISHGGALSTAEASYHGVPVVGIPFFADQYINVNIIEKKGIGVRVDFVTMTANTLLDKINEILHNPKYLQNAKKLSHIIKDQPQTPLERAVFWVEFVIRNNGTHILDPASRYMSYFVTSSLDIYLFLASVIIVILWLMLKFLSLIKYFLYRNTEKLKDE